MNHLTDGPHEPPGDSGTPGPVEPGDRVPEGGDHPAGDTTDLVLATVRQFLHARTEDEVVEALVAAVDALGGSVTTPEAGGADALPLDLSFGSGDPLVPRAGSASAHRVLLEVLPRLAEDARAALARIRRVDHFHEAASTDALTGLVNRRGLVRVMGRLGPGDTVAIIDLDHFKAVNDTLGHDAGDEVLQGLADCLRASARAGDTLGRLGGEEFVWVMSNTSVGDAQAALRRLEAAWSSPGSSRPTTFSAGIAAVTDDGIRALRRADQALYRAKAMGRARVELADATGAEADARGHR